MFLGLNCVDNVYYKVLSVILGVLPVFWSNLLDKVKKYESELTPYDSRESSVSPVSTTIPTNE